MAVTQCSTAASIEVGMVHEASFVFSHDEVAAYCKLCGDHNAIHHSVEAAALRFPEARDIIVPGGLIQISITGIFGSQFPGDGSLGLTFTPERFRKPVFPGETIRVRLEVTRKRGEMIEFDIAVFDPNDEQIGAAKSRLIAPDDGYHAWWSENIQA